MKKAVYIFLAIVICCCSISLVACAYSKLKASFVRFDIGERQDDFYLDFTVKFENKTNSTVTIDANDFDIEINGKKKIVGSFLYEFQDTFIAYPSIEKNETLILRVRVIAEVNRGEHNTILVKYNNSVLVDDNVYFNK